jgi:hypothetical protein
VVAQAAAVKRRKEGPFDNIIQRDKKLKLVLKLRNILVASPNRVMSLRDLGRFRRDLGLTSKRHLITLLKRFPGVFVVVEEGVYSLRFRLTPAAGHRYLDELQLRNESEGIAVAKLRKLHPHRADRAPQGRPRPAAQLQGHHLRQVPAALPRHAFTDSCLPTVVLGGGYLPGAGLSAELVGRGLPVTNQVNARSFGC